MFKIEECNESNMDLIKSFIGSIPSIKDIEEDIISNASVVKDEENIVATLSYEKISKSALVRYFIFNPKINNEIIYALLDNVLKKAKRNGIDKMYSISTCDEVYNLFKVLDFNKLDKKYVYIDEKLVSDLKKTIFMYKMLG